MDVARRFLFEEVENFSQFLLFIFIMSCRFLKLLTTLNYEVWAINLASKAFDEYEVHWFVVELSTRLVKGIIKLHSSVNC